MGVSRSFLNRLASALPGGYSADSAPASEPTAWAAIALAEAGSLGPARKACDWLARVQQRTGAVGVTADQDLPAWPTSLAILAWQTYDAHAQGKHYQANIDAAVAWALNTSGRTVERKPQIGHDTTLVGWSWAPDTHSWLEPTAMFIRALYAAGHATHPRTLEATRMIVDRLLPTGGANYGNTRVLDQYLLPHVQPTGLAMWALAAAGPDSLEGRDPRIGASLDYLQAAIARPLGVASAAYAVMGLRSHGRQSGEIDALLQSLAERSLRERSPYKMALVAAATQTCVRPEANGGAASNPPSHNATSNTTAAPA
ncbi:MAG: hypothetical protein AAF790_00885 [Planctomycetota bacterium]